MARAPNGKAIRPDRRTRTERRRLERLVAKARERGDHETWRRAKAVLLYLAGEAVLTIAPMLDVTRGSVNRWLQWFNARGTDGLKPRKAPGPAPRLTPDQLAELADTIRAGPQSAGYQSGIWTGPMIGDWIRQTYGVKYHNHHIPRLLHRLGFSVQRPRKRLARADRERQAHWLRETFPRIKKKQHAVAV